MRLDRSHASACRVTRLITVDRCADLPVSLPVTINELEVRCVLLVCIQRQAVLKLHHMSFWFVVKKKKKKNLENIF